MLYFSPLVINPSEYCFSYSSILFLVSLISPCLVLGIIKSSLPNEIPALKACLNPRVFILSQKITVSFCPQYLKITSITSETFFLVNNLSTKVNFKLWFLGSKLANKNLPAVLIYFCLIIILFSSTVSNTEIILVCKLIDLFSKACSISSIFENIPFGFSALDVCDK